MARTPNAVTRALRFTLFTAVIRCACSFLFVREGLDAKGKPNNTGQAVSTFLKYVGIREPAPWCAAFVSYVLGTMLLDLYKLPKTASCQEILDAARKLDIVYDVPERGDIGLLLNDAGHAHHTWLVDSVYGDQFDTVEGNTNDDGSPDGNGVYRRTRSIKNDGLTYKFVRWIDA